jgi:Cellulase (glycosyl hydrolase family 5)
MTSSAGNRVLRRSVYLLLALTFAVASVVGLVRASDAGARQLQTGFVDPGTAESFDGAVSNGASIVRINVRWSHVAPNRPTVATNPADPAYDFSHLDDLVSAASSRGLNVILTVYRAPRWAEGKNQPASGPYGWPGSWKPDAKAFGAFGQALAARYSGSFRTSPVAVPLPRVRYFEAWNEPNLGQYLAPQWTDGGKPKGPELYRQLLNSFYAGVKAAVPSDTVIGGATAPFGDPPNKDAKRMRPLTFLEGLFCLKGSKLRPIKCSSKPHLDVLAHHPVNVIYPPQRKALSRNDILVADFQRVREVMRKAARAGHVRPTGTHPLWADEIWWITKPNKAGVSLHQQAKWLEESLYMLWKQGASVVLNLQVRDAKYDPDHPYASLQTGVFRYDGTKKPAYRTFRFPFVGDRRSKKKVSFWGRSPQSGTVLVQKKTRKGWHTVARTNVNAGEVFKGSVRMRGAGKLRAEVGSETSLPWHVGSKPKRKAAGSASMARAAAPRSVTSPAASGDLGVLSQLAENP